MTASHLAQMYQKGLVNLLILLAFVMPASTIYYMDDTNGNIVHTGPPTKWSELRADTDSWLMESPEIYSATLTRKAQLLSIHHANLSFNTDSICETVDNCTITIPFTGSGITIYGILRSSLTIGITVEGKSSTFNFVDNNSCLNGTKKGCFNETLYNAQFLSYGDHNVIISMFTVPQSIRNLSYSDFYLDYVVINETLADTTAPTPSISPSPSISPPPSISPNLPVGVTPSPTSTTTTTPTHTCKRPCLSIGAIVAIAVASLIACVALLSFLVQYRRRLGQSVVDASLRDPPRNDTQTDETGNTKSTPNGAPDSEGLPRATTLLRLHEICYCH